MLDFFTVIIFFSPLEPWCLIYWAYFRYYYCRELAGYVSKKIMAKAEEFDWNISNAAEFEILFNYSIYLQKSIVFKKFT